MNAFTNLFVDKRLPESKAFLALRNAAAAQVLLIFFRKRRVQKIRGRKGRKEFSITNNGELEFTFIEAQEKYHFTRPRFDRAIQDLISTGFITVTEPGGGVHKERTKFSLIDNWLKYGTPGFEPGERKRSAGPNPGFQKGNQLWRKRR